MFKPQRSFSSGEIAPELHSRADTTKYQQAAKTCENFVVQKFGGVIKRPGTRYVGECALTDAKVEGEWGPPRLIPWNTDSQNGYVLEFGHKTLRVIKDGAYVKVTGGWSAINSISTAGLVTLNTKPSQRKTLMSGNALVQISGVWTQAPELEGGLYRAGEYTDASNPTFYLHDFTNDTDGNRRVTGSVVAGAGWVDVIYEQPTQIPLAAARDMRYSMSNGVMTLTHQDIPLLELFKGSGVDQWFFNSPFGVDGNVKVRSVKTGKIVSILPPTAGSLTTDAYRERTSAQVEKIRTWKRYCVTTVDGQGNESLPRYTNYIQSIDGDDDPDLFSTGTNTNYTTGSLDTTLSYNEARGPNGGYSGVKVSISRKTGSAIYGNERFTISGKDYYGNDITETVSASSFEGDGSSTLYNSMRVNTVNYFRSFDSIITNNRQGTASYYVGSKGWDQNNITISWSESPSKEDLELPVTYKIYRSDGGLYGLIGVATSQESSGATIRFTDSNREPDYTATPPVPYTPFPDRAEDKAWKYALSPGSVCHYQQRRLCAGSDTFPSRVWASGTGRTGDFSTRHVLTASSPFYFELAADRFQNIMHMLSLNKIVIFTDAGEWVLEGDEAGAITPTQINARQLSHMGSGVLAPEMIGNDAVFYQPRGSVVRDLGYTFKGLTESSDLTLYSYHLTRGKRIKAWAYQRTPNSVLWCVREDGVLLSMTYIKEQQIIGWAKHQIGGGGKVHSVCVVPEDQEDAVYLVVERVGLTAFDNMPKFFVERLTNPDPPEKKLYTGVDSAVVRDGWRDESKNCGTMTLSNPDGTYGWTKGSKVRVTLSAPLFDPQSRFFSVSSREIVLNPNGGGDEFVPEGGWLPNIITYDVDFSKLYYIQNQQGSLGYPADNKLIVGQEKPAQAKPGSLGQFLRPTNLRAAHLTGGGHTGSSALRVLKYISPTEVDAIITGAAGIPAGQRDTALNVWTYAGITFRNDAVQVDEISSGGFAVGASVTVTAKCPVFNDPLSVGDQIHIGTHDGGTSNSIITIAAVASATVATGTVSQAAVPSYARAQYTYKWGYARAKVYGLNHLRGEQVSVYADGRIQSSPYNPDIGTLTVDADDGTLTLTTPAVVCHVGLPYVSDLETLEIDALGGQPYGDKQVRVSQVTVDCVESQGGHVGPDIPSSSTSLENMVPIWLEEPGETQTSSVRTGKFTTVIKANWGSNGRIAIRHVDPSPMNILAAHPDVQVTAKGSRR